LYVRGRKFLLKMNKKRLQFILKCILLVNYEFSPQTKAKALKNDVFGQGLKTFLKNIYFVSVFGFGFFQHFLLLLFFKNGFIFSFQFRFFEFHNVSFRFSSSQIFSVSFRSVSEKLSLIPFRSVTLRFLTPGFG
jgi:hypothetical protein